MADYARFGSCGWTCMVNAHLRSGWWNLKRKGYQNQDPAAMQHCLRHADLV